MSVRSIFSISLKSLALSTFVGQTPSTAANATQAIRQTAAIIIVFIVVSPFGLFSLTM